MAAAVSSLYAAAGSRTVNVVPAPTAEVTSSRTEHRHTQKQALDALAQFLRERGRDDEAAELEARRERLLSDAGSAAPIA